MNEVSRTYTDSTVVRMIERILSAAPTDHMLGLQVRNLFELRAEELHRLGVTELPDQTDWTDAGSGPGYSTAWERHDDPEADR